MDLFDGILAKGRPKVIDGLAPIRILYNKYAWEAVPPGVEPVVLDLEDHRLYSKASAEVDAAVGRYARLLDAVPASDVGVYADPYHFPHSRPENWALFQQTLRNNSAILKHVTALYPSCYGYTTDRLQWAANIGADLAAAKQTGLPVRPFVWPQWHEMTKRMTNGVNDDVDLDTLRFHCEFIRSFDVDGIVVWTNHTARWTDNPPWLGVIRDVFGGRKA